MQLCPGVDLPLEAGTCGRLIWPESTRCTACPAHPGDQRPDSVADRFVVAPGEELLEHAVQLRQLALDQPADGPAARELHRARRGVEPNAAAIGARPLGEQPPIRYLAGT